VVKLKYIYLTVVHRFN